MRLAADGTTRWRGVVSTRDDTFTLFLMIAKQPDGTLSAFMRNPERNIGVFYDVSRVVLNGKAVQLMGHRLGQKTDEVLLEGSYDGENDLLSIAFPSRGGTYDFRREGEDSNFYPRGKKAQRYAYRAPPARDDGWATATLEQERIDRAAIEKFVQLLIDMPIENVHTPEVHGVLIARHGKLVLEEYFHGEHRDRLHETRSAAKSMTATVIGAAMHAGAPVQLSTPVYAAMNGGKLPADLDAQKRAMTLEHLLMMRSGYFCDDNNPDAPGNEDAMLDQTDEPDYYRYTLRLPLDREPGAKGVYCSIDPNLALGVLGRATNESPLDIYDRLVGEPLQTATYAWPLSPAGQPYGGGGMQVLPRDFMKLGQVMLDGRHLERQAHSRRRLRQARGRTAARPARHPVRLPVVEHRVPLQGSQVARVLCRRQRRASRDGRARARPGDRRVWRQLRGSRQPGAAAGVRASLHPAGST